MSSALLGSVVVPIASPDDARVTARALAEYAADVDHVTVVHVVERAGGASADADGLESVVEGVHAAFEAALGKGAVEARRVFHTDVVDGILDATAATGATAIVFSPRDGGRLVRYLSGDVALRLVTESSVPVITLPRAADGQ